MSGDDERTLAGLRAGWRAGADTAKEYLAQAGRTVYGNRYYTPQEAMHAARLAAFYAMEAFMGTSCAVAAVVPATTETKEQDHG